MLPIALLITSDTIGAGFAVAFDNQPERLSLCAWVMTYTRTTFYNDRRPHSQLGWRTPSEFAMTCHPRRDMALRYTEGSAPAPTAQLRKSNGKGELRTG